MKHVDEGWQFVRTGQPTTTPLIGEYGGRHAATAELDPLKSMRMAVDQSAHFVMPSGQTSRSAQTFIRASIRRTPSHCAAELEEFKPFFVEDAVALRKPRHPTKNVRRQTNVPLAAGEHWWSKWSFREVIEDESIDYCRIDLCIVGGITETLKITHWAEAHYIDIVPHNPLGPVSAAAWRLRLHGIHQRRRARDAPPTRHLLH